MKRGFVARERFLGLRASLLWLGPMTLAAALAVQPAAAGIVQTNLVSDIGGLAAVTDPNLVDPRGIAFSPTSPFWVANTGTGLGTLYNGAGAIQPLVVTVPPQLGGTPPGRPTGVVFNATADFEVGPGAPARFLFATQDGTISGWSPAASATTALVQVSDVNAVYTGLTNGVAAAANYIYVANFAAGRIDTFNGTFAPTTTPGGFTDPTLPAGYAPFNIQNLGGVLYVTYALQDATGKAPDTGAGHGIVDAFSTDGVLLRRVVSNGPLDTPWGLALAPAGFDMFGGDLLVGNFGDGKINAFDPLTGMLEGTLADLMGDPLVIEGLWGLIFGNGGNGGDPQTLYFTAGIPGPDTVGSHGLLGSLAAESTVAAPEPASLALFGFGLAGLGFVRRRSRGRSY